jgi:hypothetical protein
MTTGRGCRASWSLQPPQQRIFVVMGPRLRGDDVERGFASSLRNTTNIVAAKFYSPSSRASEARPGTHMHRQRLSYKLEPPAAATTDICGYGSPAFAGTTWRKISLRHCETQRISLQQNFIRRRPGARSEPGTHKHRQRLACKLEPPAAATMDICGYGSPPSRGRRGERFRFVTAKDNEYRCSKILFAVVPGREANPGPRDSGFDASASPRNDEQQKTRSFGPGF